MARTLSTTAIKAMMMARTNELFLCLLKLDHDDWASPVYLVNDTLQLTSNGDIYNPFPFVVVFPTESKDDPNAVCTLELDATDRRVIELVRANNTGIKIAISIIIKSEPDTVLVGPMNYGMTGWNTPSETVITTKLQSTNILSERAGGNTFNPSEFPGAF